MVCGGLGWFAVIRWTGSGKNVWSSLKVQWQLPHLANEAYFALFSMGAHVTGMTPLTG